MKRSGTAGIRVAAILGSVLGVAVVCSALWQWSVLSRHNTIQQLQDLPVHSVVHLVGVVTYIDGPGNRFWIQDETGAVPISVNPAQAGVHPGQTVAIEATKTARYDPLIGPASFALQRVNIRSTAGHVQLPQPFPMTLASFPSPEKNGIRVQMSAVTRTATLDTQGRAHLFIANYGSEVELIVARPARDFSKLIDTQVSIVALPEQERTAKGVVVRNRLWMANGRDLSVQQPAPVSVPLDSIRTLYLRNWAGNWHRVRLRGRIARVYPNAIVVDDQWGEIECMLPAPQALQVGSIVEVEGYGSLDGLRIGLTHSHVTVLPADPSGQAAAQGVNPASLTTVSAVRSLSPSQAAMAQPVRMIGVISYIDRQWRQIYFHDPTGGIYVKYSGYHPEITVGKRVTLAGLTNPGNFAPVIVAPRISVAGDAPVPPPAQVTIEKAAAGLLDAQYVSIEGVVHPIKVGEESSHPMLTFELLTAIGQVHVYTSTTFPDLEHSRDLEDAKVRIHGVFGTVFNSRRQLVGYQLLVESRSDIEVIEPAVLHPFAMETTATGDLLRFSPRARFGHRVKVQGTVTLVQPGHVYLQDRSDGVEVRGDTRPLHVGEIIEAIGYPTLVGRYSPVMTDAVFRSTGRSGSVAPQVMSAETILQGHQDSMLVTIEGKLLMALDSPGRRSLVLQSGVRTFTAQLNTPDIGEEPWQQVREGSVLRLTGVCSAQVDPNEIYRILAEDPTSFQILLRSPSDLTVIRPAPFWTQQTTLALLAILSLMILAILTWVGVLRRRVRRQVAALRKASETAQAIKDLSTAMQEVSIQQRLDGHVSVRGSQEVAQLVVGFNTMLSELHQRDRAKREAEARLQHMALIDDLTGLPNRRLLTDRLAQCLAKARRENRMVALLYIDLDGFKLVNDNLGHSVGDQLLGQVAQRLKSRFRQSDTLARIGGDEFTLILDNIQSKADAERAADSLLDVLKAPFEIDHHSVRIGASIGVSLFPEHGFEGGQLLQQADCAMYAAKRNGKNRVVHFGDDLGNAARERLTLEGELRRAIADAEITVHYQPEYDLETSSIVRFEALARWTHPTLGPIPPLNFIPVAEESGLIIPLGAYVMEQACRDAVTWQTTTARPIQVGVNVSSVQFARESFVEEVEEILHRTGLKPGLLQIEITESATMTGIERAADKMRRLKAMGISVAMDDFGTGYSCLGYLPKLSFDALKIDRSFVNELMVRPETRAFVESILTLAHNLNMKVIVEGIETREQLDLTRSLGANEAQGYLLGRPSGDPMEQFRRGWEPTEFVQGIAAEALETVP